MEIQSGEIVKHIDNKPRGSFTTNIQPSPKEWWNQIIYYGAVSKHLVDFITVILDNIFVVESDKQADESEDAFGEN